MRLKPKELKIDAEKPFDNDAFDRQKLVESLGNIIRGLEGPFVMAIDSPWGTGKTTVVQMLQAVLEGHGHPCLYFNAWETDFADDPLVAFLGELDSLLKQISPGEGERKETIEKMKKMAGAVAKRAIPAAVRIITMGSVDLAPEIERAVAEATGAVGGDLVDHYLKQKEVLATFRDSLNETLAVATEYEKKLPIVIFVDELDRCRPLYAIELLERIKHVLDVSSVVFVIALDKAQLGISLGCVYGAGFNSKEYLRRFFDIEFKLNRVADVRFSHALFERLELDRFFASRPGSRATEEAGWLRDTFVQVCRLLDLTPRAQERCMVLVSLAMRATPPDRQFFPIQTAILAAFRIAKEDIYIDVTRNGGSVLKILNCLEDRVKESGGVDNHLFVVWVGMILALRVHDDKDANSKVENFRLRERSAIREGHHDQEAELIMSMADQSAFRFNSLKTIVERIDLVSNFS